MRIRALTLALLFAPTVYFGQQVTPEMLLHPPANSWPTYNGDYSGRRFSSLKQIDAKNVASLKTAWVYRAKNYGKAGFGSVIKSTPLEVNGALYFTMPDNIWAVDARTGREIWHYKYPPNQGMHIGQRGVAMWGNWLYFESPDCNLISLDAKDGKVRWQKKIADVKLEYFCTMSPLVVGNHIVAGVGGDSLDNPGYLLSLDPETGAVQWRWDTEPSPGQPGANTWPDANARKHGGGMTWMTGTYDPELHLIYWGIGNPNPVHDGATRKGDDLWTCSIVALNVDTGKMAWGYQVSPHDTHDWDAVQTPVLFDAVIHGKKRKLLAQASRNGYFFVLDRTNGHHILTAPFIHTNWTLGLNPNGQPIPNPKKEPTRNGTLVSPSSNGATNWFAPSFDPQTGLFYVMASQSYSVFYLTAEGKPEGFAGRDDFLNFPGKVEAIDYQTGKIRWTHDMGGVGTGLLTTAGGLLFAGDTSAHFLAIDAKTGKTLWHAGIGANQMNGAITYMLDGKQYVLVGAGDSLVAFTLPSEVAGSTTP
ncbi:MAG: acido-empty-quinoprotein group A [Bryobacteraceae bacterium]